jgi:F0F1-type ATP synthase alpha subunit
LQNFFQAQLETAETRSPVLDVGTVVSIGDGIARVYGCEACLAGELLEFTEGSPWSGRRIRWRTSLWGNSTEAVSSTPREAMIPIGRGQRELIIGDRQTGKQPTPATA